MSYRSVSDLLMVGAEIFKACAGAILMASWSNEFLSDIYVGPIYPNRGAELWEAVTTDSAPAFLDP